MARFIIVAVLPSLCSGRLPEANKSWLHGPELDVVVSLTFGTTSRIIIMSSRQTVTDGNLAFNDEIQGLSSSGQAYTTRTRQNDESLAFANIPHAQPGPNQDSPPFENTTWPMSQNVPVANYVDESCQCLVPYQINQYGYPNPFTMPTADIPTPNVSFDFINQYAPAYPHMAANGSCQCINCLTGEASPPPCSELENNSHRNLDHESTIEALARRPPDESGRPTPQPNNPRNSADL